MAIANAHPYEDIEKGFKIVPISVALALEYLDCNELHSSSPVTSSTRHVIQLLSHVHVNPSFGSPSAAAVVMVILFSEMSQWSIFPSSRRDL